MTTSRPINPSLFLRPEELRRAADLMLFAHRDFSRLGHEILTDAGLGAADHRALHVIGRNPNMTVGALLATLKVTKQSLHRTLRQLVDQGLFVQNLSRNARRQKLLRLSEEGETLLKAVEARQHDRIIAAYRKAGPNAIAPFWEILLYLTDPEDREAIRHALDLDDVLP
ncbi:MAG: MarR family winged helix-turn-helix transcriptional regulator [Sphingomonadales bacterium]